MGATNGNKTQKRERERNCSMFINVDLARDKWRFDGMKCELARDNEDLTV